VPTGRRATRGQPRNPVERADPPCIRRDGGGLRRPRLASGRRVRRGRAREVRLEWVLSEGAVRARRGDLGCARRVREGVRHGDRRFRDRRRHPPHVRLSGRSVRRGRDGTRSARRRAIAGHRRSNSRRRRRRRGRKHRSRLRVGHRHGRRRRRRRSERRKEDLRVDVALGIRAEPNAELDVRHRVLGNAARPHDRDGLAFGNDCAARDQGRAEVQERDGVAVGRLDRDRQTVRRDPADERDRAGGRSENRIAERTLDVDAAMLTRRQGVVLGEEEATQDRPVDRPRPRSCGGGDEEGARRQNRDEEEERWVSLPGLQTATTVAGLGGCCQIGLQ
jgi:hypothetical protein